MAQFDEIVESLGQRIQDIVDRAVSSRDYQALNQTVRDTLGRAAELGEEAVRKVLEVPAAEKPAPQAPLPPAALYGKTGGRTALSILKIVGGSALCATTGTALLVAAVVGLITPSLVEFGTSAALLLGGLGASIWLLAAGVGSLSQLRRFKTYRRLLGNKTHCTLKKLASAVGKTEKQVQRDVKKMIAQGLFLEGHLDYERTRLITSEATFRQYEESRLQLEERQRQEALLQAQPAPAPSPVQEVLDKGSDFLAQIRRCNEEIPGEEISGKISRMELIVQRIFRRAETNPEIVPDLKKLMDYYLPMTVKLLQAYADMDAQPVQGDTILASKREIEGTLDTLNLAFEKLLDSVFQDTALDVSSDISVLNTLLAQEGLTQDPLEDLRKNTNANS